MERNGMPRQFELLSLLTFPMLILMIGCDQRVDYAVKNVGAEMIDEVGIFINDGHSFKHGILKPQIHSGFGGSFKVLRENKVTIIWKDARSGEHTVELQVSGKDLRDPRNIMFVIGDDENVTTEWRFNR